MISSGCPVSLFYLPSNSRWGIRKHTNGVSSIPNSSYRVEIKGAGHDFESEPEPEHASEILILTSTVRTKPCVSKSKAGGWCFRSTISNESVEKAPEQISSLDVMKNGFVIRSTIEDLLLGYGNMTPEKGVKNIKWTFSTDSTQIITLLEPKKQSRALPFPRREELTCGEH